MGDQIDSQFAIMAFSRAGRRRRANEYNNDKTYGADAVGVNYNASCDYSRKQASAYGLEEGGIAAAGAIEAGGPLVGLGVGLAKGDVQKAFSKEGADTLKSVPDVLGRAGEADWGCAFGFGCNDERLVKFGCRGKYWHIQGEPMHCPPTYPWLYQSSQGTINLYCGKTKPIPNTNGRGCGIMYDQYVKAGTFPWKVEKYANGGTVPDPNNPKDWHWRDGKKHPKFFGPRVDGYRQRCPHDCKGGGEDPGCVRVPECGCMGKNRDWGHTCR